MKPKKQRKLRSVDADSLSEAYSTTFSTSTYEAGEIEVAHNYTLTYIDEPFFHQSDLDVYLDNRGEWIQIPAIEMDGECDKLYVDKAVTQEQLDSPSERVINELAFRAIVNPFDLDEIPVHSFHEAAERMRVIMEVMRTGINVSQLHDI